MEQLRGVFAYWVGLDRDNCELVRTGLLRFRRPGSYTTNELPSTNSQLDLLYADDEILKCGIFRLAEALDCIGGQLANRGNLQFGREAVVLLDRIRKEFPGAFDGNPFWNARIPSPMMDTYVVQRLSRHTDGASYHYSGLDAVEEAFAEIPLVQKYLQSQ
jgi:hypothetical protein